MRINLLFLLVLSFCSCNRLADNINAISKNNEALDLLNAGYYEEANLVFKETLKYKQLTPSTKSTLYRNIAQSFYYLEMPDSFYHYAKLAADCFEKGTYDNMVNTADLHLNKEEVDSAIVLLEKSVKLNNERMEAHNSLGVIFLGDYNIDETNYSDFNKALKHNLKAHQLNNDRTTKDVLARNYLELEEYDNARKYYLELIKEYPALTYQFELGKVEYLDGQEAAAEKYFKELIELDPAYEIEIKIFKLTADL